MATPVESRPGWGPRLRAWIDARIPYTPFVERHLTEYPTPKNLNCWWNFGSLAGTFFLIQIVTGIFLAFHYKPDSNLAFASVQHIVRDVNWGWLLRDLHAIGGTAFFVILYVHMFRGLYYGSYKYPRELIWWIGLLLFTAMMATAFSGYLLVWGQMSYWAAQVITNVPSAIPVIGEPIVVWLRGGFVVGDATLNRFFAMHAVLFPAIIATLIVLHLSALHRVGSGNPTGMDLKAEDKVPFHPYYGYKDLWFGSAFFLVFLGFVFYAPDAFSVPDNFVEANPFQTPSHIVPEWYLLPYYAILRSIPSKLGGVVALLGAFIVFFLMPLLDRSPVRSGGLRPIYRWVWLTLVLDFLALAWVGANPPEQPYTVVGQIATAGYFLFFASLPFVTRLERRMARTGGP